MPGAIPPKFRFSYGSVKDLLLESGLKWSEDGVSRLSAAFSFYAVLSLSPLLVFAVAIGGLVLASAEKDLVYEASGFVGEKGAEFLHTLIRTTAQPGAGLLATVTSLFIAFFGASNLFLQLDMTMDTIWKVKSSDQFVMQLIKTRVVAFLGVLVFGTLVVAWLLFDWWLRWLAHHSVGGVPWTVVSLIGSSLVLVLAFGVSFKALPANQLEWNDVWPAALLTSVGFDLSKWVLNTYFQYAGVSAAYGAAGALVVILLWIYYTSQIYFFGAEFAYVWAHKYGSAYRAKPLEEPKAEERSQAKAL